MSIERNGPPGPVKIIYQDGSSVTPTPGGGIVIEDPDGPIPFYAAIPMDPVPPCAHEAMDEFRSKSAQYLPDERRVLLGGERDQPRVNGKLKPRLTVPQYHVVKALMEAGRTD